MGKRTLHLSDRKQSTYSRETKRRKSSEKLEINANWMPELCLLNLSADDDNDSDSFNDEMLEMPALSNDTDAQTDILEEQTTSSQTQVVGGEILDQFITINNWLNTSGHKDLFTHWAFAIMKGLLKEGNIAFILFAEFVKKMVTPHTFQYSAQSLLWWITGWKQHGGSWLRNMAGTPQKPVYTVPCVDTLKSLCPTAIRMTGSRKPGNILFVSLTYEQ